MVVLFSQQYPNCNIILEYSTYSTEEGSDVTYDDAIRNLNTKLLAGNSPDVLFLDGLPIEALNQQGILSNINLDIDTSKYYENVLNSYTNSGGIYAYPTALNLFLFASSEASTNLSEHNTMENIANLYKDPKAIQIGSTSTIFHTFYYATYHKIFPDYKTVNEEALKELLVQTKKMVVSSKNNRSSSSGFRHKMSNSHATIVGNPLGASYLFLTHENVTVAPLLDGVYMNKNIASIPTDAKNKMRAQDFILMLLEDEKGKESNVANRYFSVKKGVDKETISDFLENNISETSTNTNYISDYLAVNWEGLISDLKYSSEEDYILKDIVHKEALQFYESQSEDVDAVVLRIMNKLKLLIAERN